MTMRYMLRSAASAALLILAAGASASAENKPALPSAAKPGATIPAGLPFGLPDLAIEGANADSADPTKLFVKVVNHGAVASTPTNLKAIRWNGNQETMHGTLVPALQPGQAQVVLAELGGTLAGATQLTVRVDDPNRIKEQDETNNSYEVK